MQSTADALLPTREGEPDDKIDAAAVVGQFLRDVDLADLVVELVQNELDAGATRTVIDFGERALTCEGDGRPFDRKGWLRLESVLGAGGDVEAKKDGIGSKNHGLRSAFLLADRIGVQSGGLRADLTVRGDLKRPDRFKPAFWTRIADAAAPMQGTRITAPYRLAALRRPDGDNTQLQPPTSAELDALWRDAVAAAPERFLTASQPGAPWSYTLILTRHGQPPCELRYECKALAGSHRGLWLRTCKTPVNGKARVIARRHALRFPISVTDGGKIPRLFRAGSRLFGELSWRASLRDKPQPTVGGLRYPIAFPAGQARSGHSFDISAPFIAGRARHGLSSDPRNTDLLAQGRSAMAEAGSLLARAYGPSLGDLVRSEDPHEADLEAEHALVSGWLDHGGVSIVLFGKGELPAPSGCAPLSPGASALLARASGRGGIEATLCSLAAAVGAVISPDHSQVVLDVLERLAAQDDKRVSRFDEASAARLVLIETLRPEQRIGSRELLRAGAALACLDSLRRSGGLPGALVAELKAKGALPAYSGVAVEWSEARFHDQAPPEIPGVHSPAVIHPSLKDAPALSLGALALRKFDLNEFVGELDFEPVGAAGRQRFFTWLRDGASTLRATTLRKIAAYPIWPGADGEARPLDAYCRPKAHRMLEVLADSLLAPAPAVVSLTSARGLPPGALKLRDQPTTEELLAWHAARMVAVEAEADLAKQRAQLDALEADLDWLRTREPTAVKAIGAAHQTLSQAGELEPVTILHVPDATTLACGLSPKVLCRPRRAALYADLGARPRPSAAALVAALREDPDLSKLFIRLEAYHALGLDLAELSAEPIIPVDGALCAGETLAFAGDPDYWGAWKGRLKAGDVAQHHGVLSELGVIRSNVTKDGSLAFFRWLAAQPRTVQREHHTQIARHWRERLAGPPSWALHHVEVPCVPVTGKGQGFDLVSLSVARAFSQDIYLDDFPEIRDAVLQESKARLTLIKAPGFTYSSLDAFAAANVPSLRRTVGPPRAISISGSLSVAADLDAELARLQTGPALAALKTRLPLHEIALSDLRADWQPLIKALKGVRVSGGLTAVYRFLGRDYEVPVAGGVDPASHLICLSKDADRQNELYAVLARHIFRPGAPESAAWGLMRAARDRRQLNLFEAETADEGDDAGGNPDGEADKPAGGDVHTGHGISAAKLAPVVPNPTPLNDISDVTRLSGRKRKHKAISPSKNEAQSNSVEEEEQKRQLKHDHYGYHCQACLGEMDVLKAAPPGTYVFAPGYRQRLLHAHHAHQTQNQGIIGGKNLLILCEYHHRLWGDRLSRDKVLAGLAGATGIRRNFPRDSEGKVLERKEGLLASVALDVAPFEAKLYFTKLHAAAWQAPA